MSKLFVFVVALALACVHCIPASQVLQDLQRIKRDLSHLHNEVPISFRKQGREAFLAERAPADTPLVTSGPGMLTDVVQPPNGPAITIVRITAGFDKVPIESVFPKSMLTWKPSFTPLAADNAALLAEQLSYATQWVKSWSVGSPGALLKTIYISDSFSLDGNGFGGFFYALPGDVIWMSRGWSYDNFASSLFHENVHLTQHHKAGDDTDSWNVRWNALLPAGWTWKGQCGKPCDRDFMENLWPSGFLTGYSTVSQAEDVAQCGNAAFMGTKNLVRAARQVPIIQKKYDLIVELFQRVDPGFNKAFFDKKMELGRERTYASNEFRGQFAPPGFNIRGFTHGVNHETQYA